MGREGREGGKRGREGGREERRKGGREGGREGREEGKGGREGEIVNKRLSVRMLACSVSLHTNAICSSLRPDP